VFRVLGGDTTVHFTPVASLPFATPITWQLTAAITDVAGNALVDANGNPLTQPLIFTFTTGNFVITQPVDGGNVVENRRLLLEARGDAALPIATVTFTVGGQVLPTVSGPPFTTVIVTPRAPTSLTITAVARSSTGAELVRHEVVVNVVVGLEIQPRLVGLQLGGMATLRLELSSALSTDLTVDLHAADPAVVLLPATAEIPTGQTVVPVTALGGASGSTTVLASSSLDTAASIVSVRESMPPQQLQVFTPAAGLMVVPALSVGQVVMPGSGRQTLTVRLLASPAAADTQMVVTSSNPAIANVTGPVSILAGTRVAALTLVTGQTGEAVLVLRAGPEVRQLTVFVGEPPTLRLPLALAASVGLAVLPPLPVGQVIVPTVGSQPPLTVRLLSNPAPQAMPVTVRSSNPDVADVVRPVTVPTGSQVAELTLVTREVGKATVTLQTDTEVFGLTIFVETSPEGQLLPIIAPTVGVEVAP
jgi:hypothetical protein